MQHQKSAYATHKAATFTIFAPKINHLLLWLYSPTSMICSRSARLNPTASSSRKAGTRPPSIALFVRLPTILRTLVEALATIEIDEERSFFLIDLPCRADMVENMAIDKIIRYNDSYGAVDFTKDLTKDFTKDFIKENEAELTERQKEILILLADDSTLTSQKISQKISQKKPVSSRTIKTDLFDLQKKVSLVVKVVVKTVTGNCFSCQWNDSLVLSNPFFP